jgi:ADP-L-glycero-D-manno-heptose 6-epimerase
MDKQKTILLTGAAGFIGSYLLGYLNHRGFEQIIIADDFSDQDKKENFAHKKFSAQVDRNALFGWLEENGPLVDLVFHLGARTDTTEFDYSIHEELNVKYSQRIWNYCTRWKIPLVYASSAATYGDGSLGYRDDHDVVDRLKPLNPYGVSKNEFDKWALAQRESPPSWAGLKFFNVYGPNEYHKGRMASVVFHAFNQARESGTVRLFRSHKTGFRDGEQLRDFIHVEDVASVCYWLMDHAVAPGLYNVGTGRARSFNDLARAVFSALQKKPDIRYIDIPEDIRDSYQYFTEAEMSKLREAGYSKETLSLEAGIADYVTQYLIPGKYY